MSKNFTWNLFARTLLHIFCLVIFRFPRKPWTVDPPCRNLRHLPPLAEYVCEFEEWHFFTGLDRISILKGFQVIFENSNKIILRYLTVGILFTPIPKDKEGKKFDGYFAKYLIYPWRGVAIKFTMPGLPTIAALHHWCSSRRSGFPFCLPGTSEKLSMIMGWLW